MSQITQKIKNSKGFSFIEVILTTLILSIGLMGGLALMDNSTRTSTESSLRITASQLAHEKLEMINADKTFNGYDTIVNNAYPQESLDAPFQGYSRSTDIYEVSSSDMSTYQANSGLKRIDVQVSWGNGANQNITVSTVLANY